VENDKHLGIQTLKIAACIIIVAYGVHMASHLLSILLLSLLLTFAILPFPQWLVRRFHFHRSTALSCAVFLVVALYCVLAFALARASLQMRAKLPVYEIRIHDLSQQITGLLARHGIESTGELVRSSLSAGRILQFVGYVIPTTIELFSDRLVIWVLAMLFLGALLNAERGDSPIVKGLTKFGEDIQRQIATTAETGAILAVVNLILLTVLGVDFAVVWCVLYFFLRFIPSLGFVIALVPPTLLALLMLGWKRALLVLAVMVLTQTVGGSILNPIILKKKINVSLGEVTLSLLFWGYLIGPAGAVVSVPLTLALRRFIDRARTSASPSLQHSPLAP